MLSLFRTLLIIILGVLSWSAQAQHVKLLIFKLPKKPVLNSLYNKIAVLDTRTDSTDMGLIYTGTFNRTAAVVVEPTLHAQLDKVLSGTTDSTAKDGELLLHIQHIRFAELASTFKEVGYFYLKADLYTHNHSGYKKLAAIDTLVLKKSAVDVTETILDAGQETIVNFIRGNLLKASVSTENLSLEQIKRLGEVTPTYVNGLYASYGSFVKQQPDLKIEIKKKSDGKSQELYAFSKAGKEYKAPVERMVLIADNNKLYLIKRPGFWGNESPYFPIDKVTGDLYAMLPLGTPVTRAGKTTRIATIAVIYSTIAAFLIILAVKDGEHVGGAQ